MPWKRSLYLLWALSAWGLGAGTSVQAQGSTLDLLTIAQQTFDQRLETTLRYQQAVEADGVRAVTRCLQVGQRAYVLERYTATPQGLGRVTERYQLLSQGPDTVSRSTARFLLGNEVTRRGKTACVGVFHQYTTPLTIEAGQLFIVGNFSPARFLALASELVPAGQTLYVQNTAPGVSGDTLACYRLTRVGSDRVCLTLHERQPAGSQRWHRSSRLTYRWEADLAQHQVTATQVQADGTPGGQWVRTYTNRTDFFECHFYFRPPEREGDGLAKQELYHREFKQLSPQQALDRYTLTLQTEPAQTLTFDIVHSSH
ncbi:hypothetical protein DNI29_22155 [Hymenobacter sediminis]|uniref:hypothetical protein n=1 Tax=Hymenobacter sediminis TaxID=2218621 RepID=UPI000F4D9E1E|nr:hypothetical protein [Hymenobacter sediminis]RPD44103.1 hypothetical protein DNI29_22155 [Hymenobacter sediminis]